MDKGTISEQFFYSNILGFDWEYMLYLPPNYDATNEKYSLIYMLNGATGNHKDWIQQGNAYETLNRMIDNETIESSIVIFPNGSPMNRDSWYVNSVIYNMEDAFEKELFPYIEKTYPIKSGREHHIIGGISMGGYGALRFALRNSHYFHSIFTLSPAIFTYVSGQVKKISEKEIDIENGFENDIVDIYGRPFDIALWNSLNYTGLWDDYEKHNTPLKFFVANGTFDYVTEIEHTRAFDKFLKEKNAIYTYIEQEYLEHSWGAWATILSFALEYTAKK